METKYKILTGVVLMALFFSVVPMVNAEETMTAMKKVNAKGVCTVNVTVQDSNGNPTAARVKAIYPFEYKRTGKPLITWNLWPLKRDVLKVKWFKNNVFGGFKPAVFKIPVPSGKDSVAVTLKADKYISGKNLLGTVATQTITCKKGESVAVTLKF